MLERDNGLPTTYPQPVTFSYQRGERFQSLVDLGFAENLAQSNFCWLACYDMIASAYLVNDLARKDLITRIARKTKEAGYLSENGGLSLPETDIEATHLASVSAELAASNIPLSMSLLEISNSGEIVAQLEEGHMVILGVDAGEGHAILLDKLYKDQQEQEAVLGFWDPAVPIPEIAHSFMPTTQKIFLLFDGKEHFPVIVGKNAHLVKRVPVPNGI